MGCVSFEGELTFLKFQKFKSRLIKAASLLYGKQLRKIFIKGVFVFTYSDFKTQLAKLFVDNGKDRGRNNDNDKRRNRAPDGVGFRKIPNRQNAQKSRSDERDRNHDKRNNADEFGINDSAQFFFYAPTCGALGNIELSRNF